MSSEKSSELCLISALLCTVQNSSFFFFSLSAGCHCISFILKHLVLGIPGNVFSFPFLTNQVTVNQPRMCETISRETIRS